MRPLASLLLLLALALPSAAAQAKPKPVAKPAAKPAARRAAKPKPAPAGPDRPSQLPLSASFCTVNGEAVPISVYIDRLSIMEGPKIREILVHEAIVRQEAKRRKLLATAREIEALVEQVIQRDVNSPRHRGSEQSLAQDLRQQRGWSLADYRAVIREQAETQVLQRKIAESLVKPTEINQQEVQGRYEQMRADFAVPDTAMISHILVRRPDNEQDPRFEEKERAARARAEELLKRAQGPSADFAALAKEHSEDRATGPRGGALPTPIRRNGHPFGSAFEAAVFNAPPGLIGEVIPTPLGFHVIRLESKTQGRQKPLAEVADEIRVQLLAARRAQALDELFVRLRTQAKVDTGRF